MIISAAQIKPIRGDIQANIDNHKRIIDEALGNDSDMIIFPELSLTGYEPTLAEALATMPFDPRLDAFQAVSDEANITIGVGLPLKNEPRPTISMVIFKPQQTRHVYSKKYIHADEEPYFISGHNTAVTLSQYPTTALAICYEISVPQHAQTAHQKGAEIYLASVVKTVPGTVKARERLSEIARTYSMTVVMANCVGVCDGEVCGGRSAVWNNKGDLLGGLNDTDEGILIFNTDTEAVKTKYFEEKK
jgi:predicted amidohydrolase